MNLSQNKILAIETVELRRKSRFLKVLSKIKNYRKAK
jgi:hypothetical protein